MLRTEKCPVEVSQRLKRATTIFDRLTRQPTVALSRMQDIGGCRAVVDDIEQLRRVQSRIVRNGRVSRISDYVAAPQASGYRAVHAIVTYDGRAIEVQLRTRYMHDWAMAVERFGADTGQDFKSGRGAEPVLAWLSALSAALAIEEAGLSIDTELRDRVSSLRVRALPFLTKESP